MKKRRDEANEHRNSCVHWLRLSSFSCISSAFPLPRSTMLGRAPAGCVIHGPLRFDGMYACTGQHCLCGEGGLCAEGGRLCGEGSLCAEGGQRCLLGREGRQGAMRPTNTKRGVFVSQTPELVSMREKNATCKQASTANSTGTFFLRQTPELVSMSENNTTCK